MFFPEICSVLETSPKSYRIQLKEKGNIIDTKDKG
jgi:hypothetical protein